VAGRRAHGFRSRKLKTSLRRLLDAAYKNGMFTKGLPTIQADELHSYEEGINCLAQNLILDYASPLQLERAMVTARGIEGLTGVNSTGHRHIRSAYYSGSKMAEDGPWGWSKPYSYLVCQVPELLVDFNGNPTAKKYLLELTDGLLAHRHVDANGRGLSANRDSFFRRSRGRLWPGLFSVAHVLGCVEMDGRQKYLTPIVDGGMTMSVNANALDILNLRKDTALPNIPAEGGRAVTPCRRLSPRCRAAGFRGSSGEHFAWQADGDKSPPRTSLRAADRELRDQRIHRNRGQPLDRPCRCSFD